MIKNYLIDLKSEFKNYSYQKFTKDLFAGITVGAVALPLALAFGTSSGATASAGLITGIIAGIIIGALSGASFQISGPTGAMAAILINVSFQYGMEGIFISALISGVILTLFGVLKLGRIVSFIPNSVISGFTSGIAVVIASGQINNFFGSVSTGHNLIEHITFFWQNGFALDYQTTLIGLATIILLIIYPKKLNSILPGSLTVIVLFMVLNLIFNFDVATVGLIPKSLLLDSRLHLGQINLDMLTSLMLPGVSIALLGMIESLLCGATASKMKDEHFDACRELIGQGIGNIIIPFFGGIPATAAIARTSVAIKSGSVTRLTSIIHSIFLIFAMFVFGGFIAKIPMASLAAVLIVTSWKMNDWDFIIPAFKNRIKTPIIKFAVTMAATIVFDLTIAIALGMFVAVFLFALNNSQLHIDVKDVDTTKISGLSYHHRDTKVMYLSGTIFFGTQDQIGDAVKDIRDNTQALIFSMRGVSSIDDTGICELKDIYEKLTARSIKVYFSGLSPKVQAAFNANHLTDHIPQEQFCWDAIEAITRYDQSLKISS